MFRQALPVEWGEKRLKFAAPLRNERADATSAHADYLGLENIQSWTGKLLPNANGEQVADEGAASGTANRFRKGDVLFGKLRPYLAKALHADMDGVCTTELLVMTHQPDISPRYLLYILLSKEFIGQVDASTFGSKMPRANWEFVGSMKIPVPRLDIQRRIADNLDQETARIDALVEEKERMLTLLEEKRATLISRAVTRGLDPNVPLKPSGLDWLGQIPAHWEVRTLKRSSSRIDTGSTPAATYMDGSLRPDFIWFTPGDFEKGGVLNESKRKIPREAIDDKEAKVFQSHSIMVIGIGATLGKVAISPVEFSANQQINVIVTLDDVLPEFLHYVLQGFEPVFRAHANSATLPILNQERLGSIWIAVPPLNEQLGIVAALNETRSAQFQLTETLSHSLRLLRERRAALITDAVTGQLSPEDMDS